MVNYQEDVRLGDEMLARLSESYRKIRNTWRFMLGVLSDFEPAARRGCTPPLLAETDRYILQQLAGGQRPGARRPTGISNTTPSSMPCSISSPST